MEPSKILAATGTGDWGTEDKCFVSGVIAATAPHVGRMLLDEDDAEERANYALHFHRAGKIFIGVLTGALSVDEVKDRAGQYPIALVQMSASDWIRVAFELEHKDNFARFTPAQADDVRYCLYELAKVLQELIKHPDVSACTRLECELSCVAPQASLTSPPISPRMDWCG